MHKWLIARALVATAIISWNLLGFGLVWQDGVVPVSDLERTGRPINQVSDYAIEVLKVRGYMPDSCGWVLDFDNDGDYVTVPNYDYDNCTYELHFRADSWSGDCGLIGGQSSLRVYVYTSGKVYVQVYGDGGSGTTSYWWGASTDTWHHVIVTYDGEYMKLWRDNSLKASENLSYGDLTYTTNLNIGHVWTTRYMDGNIKDVRIYDRAITESEVTEHFGGIYSDNTGLVGWWLLDEGEGTTAYDSSGNGNDATIVGASWTGETPSQPKNVQITEIASDSILVSWDTGTCGNTTLVRGKRNGCPTNTGDGFIIYEGTGVACNTTLTDLDTTTYGISLWSGNEVGYSKKYDILYGGEGMILAIGGVVLIGLLIVRFFVRKIWMDIILILYSIAGVLYTLTLSDITGMSFVTGALAVCFIWSIVNIIRGTGSA